MRGAKLSFSRQVKTGLIEHVERVRARIWRDRNDGLHVKFFNDLDVRIEFDFVARLNIAGGGRFSAQVPLYPMSTASWEFPSPDSPEDGAGVVVLRSALSTSRPIENTDSYPTNSNAEVYIYFTSGSKNSPKWEAHGGVSI